MAPLMKFPVRGSIAAVLVLACAPTAVAAPVTVNLRVEGPNRTVFEGPVTTDVRPFRFTDGTTEYQCDATAAVGGTSATPAPTSNAALLAAAEREGFAVKGQWFAGLGATFSEIGGEQVAFDPGTFRYLVEYFDNQPAAVGGCAQPLVNGSQVLYAFTDFGAPLLTLNGPATGRPGQPITVTVRNRSAGNAPVAGAVVGGATTNAAGEAQVTLTAAGVATLKAERDGFVRSNALNVCITSGDDGACGTTRPGVVLGGGAEAGGTTGAGVGPAGPVIPAAATFTGLKDGQAFTRGKGPRRLSGALRDATGTAGVLMVKLRIARRDGSRCSYFSGRSERFRPARCGVANAKWFRIGDSASWSYLLPARLPRGRYVVDVNVIDRSYNRDDRRERGRNRVIFGVR